MTTKQLLDLGTPWAVALALVATGCATHAPPATTATSPTSLNNTALDRAQEGERFALTEAKGGTATPAPTLTDGPAPRFKNTRAPVDSAARQRARDRASVTDLTPGAGIEDERNTIAVFQANAPSTVFVTQKRVVVDYFSRRSEEVESGSGSGFIWDNKGHIVTNYHVVRGAKSLTVQLYDGRTLPARVVGVAPKKDVAVIKIEAPSKSLTPISRLPKTKRVIVGQKTIAIGNPFGLEHTLTTGVVSAMGREVPGAGGVSIREMIQTDAAINPGNSGGPLLSSAGHLIGMNTMIFSGTGSSAGIGFAVPVQTIQRVVPQLITHGKAVHVGLGVVIDPGGKLENRLGIRGVIVHRVPGGTPASAAGLQGLNRRDRGFVLGDVIVRVEKEAVVDYDDLYNALDRFKPGDLVNVHVEHGESRKKRIVAIKLIELN
jgi:S1-C subfamily serine protease